MAEQYDKIIQDGRVSFVPRSNKTRAFWTKHNARVASSQNAAKETVTIVPATDAEIAELVRPSEMIRLPLSTSQSAPVNNTTLDELKKQMEAQQEQMRKQQELINQLLTEKADGGAKERGKPGPKPKNENNGEDKQTESNAKA